MRLSELQHNFLDWLASADDAVAARLPLAGDGRDGLAIYQNNYRGNLMACLADSFPHTLLWLGEAAFEAAAARHIDRVPPSSWTLDDYALGFPESLIEDYPYEAEVSELARIELALSQAFIAADAEVLKADQMGDVDWDRAMLQTIPALTILPLRSNADDIWIALAHEAPPPNAQWDETERPVLIWRQEWLCKMRRLNGDEAAMLGYLIGSEVPFADLCARAIGRWGEQDGIARIGQYLGQWVADELVRGVER